MGRARHGGYSQMDTEINIRRLWCLKTVGYHIFPTTKDKPAGVWMYDRCLTCGLSHHDNFTEGESWPPMDKYTYEDDDLVYTAGSGAERRTDHLRSSPHLTTDVDNPIV